MGLILLIQTITVIIFINKILPSSWFAIIMFIIIIGGLLVIFMYIRRIASNEKFKPRINVVLILIIILIISDEIIFRNQIIENQELLQRRNLNFSITKIYSEKSIILTIMLVLYLLLTIISVTKIVKHHKGPLRAINLYE